MLRRTCGVCARVRGSRAERVRTPVRKAQACLVEEGVAHRERRQAVVLRHLVGRYFNRCVREAEVEIGRLDGAHIRAGEAAPLVRGPPFEHVEQHHRRPAAHTAGSEAVSSRSFKRQL